MQHCVTSLCYAAAQSLRIMQPFQRTEKAAWQPPLMIGATYMHFELTSMSCSARAPRSSGAPVRLSIDGQTLVVQHGMLVSEHNPHELIETLANIEWPTEQQRNQALELCLHHLTQALEETETTLRHWELEDDLSS